jgi:hypothetical protein
MCSVPSRFFYILLRFSDFVYRSVYRVLVSGVWGDALRGPASALLFLLMMLSTCVLWGQAPAPRLPAVVAASPEASALAKYINYPVDYSSGLVNISIPLYEIKAGDITLPIGLSYHASGIKVNEN